MIRTGTTASCVAALFVLLTACRDDAEGDCYRGELGCPCLNDDSCYPGMHCDTTGKPTCVNTPPHEQSDDAGGLTPGNGDPNHEPDDGSDGFTDSDDPHRESRTCTLGEELVLVSSSAVAGDLNGDGEFDLVVPDEEEEDSEVYVRQGDDFVVRTHVEDCTGERALADLNGNGRLDLVCAYGSADLHRSCADRSVHTANVHVYFNDGDGDFSEPIYLLAYGGPAHSLHVTDLDGDGFPEIIVGSVGTPPHDDGCNTSGGHPEYHEPIVYIFHNNGDGTWGEPARVKRLWSRGDTEFDIYTANANHIVRLRTGAHMGSRSRVHGFTVADIDKDGHLDLAFTYTGGSFRYGVIDAGGMLAGTCMNNECLAAGSPTRYNPRRNERTPLSKSAGGFILYDLNENGYLDMLTDREWWFQNDEGNLQFLSCRNFDSCRSQMWASEMNFGRLLGVDDYDGDGNFNIAWWSAPQPDAPQLHIALRSDSSPELPYQFEVVQPADWAESVHRVGHHTTVAVTKSGPFDCTPSDD